MRRATKAGGDKPDPKLALWTEHLKNANTGIAARVDLQQKNANANIVLVTAILGYLINYLARHSADELITSEAVLVAAIAPVLSNIFLWRHVDHEMNVIDHARYVDGVIRPELASLSGADTVRWEEFLNESRRRRPVWSAAFSLFGNEAVVMLGGLLPFLVFDWLVILGEPGHAGSAEKLFNGLTIAASAATVVSLYLLVQVVWRYARISRVSRPTSGSPGCRPSRR